MKRALTRLTALALITGLSLGLTALPAQAEPLARASGSVKVFAGPSTTSLVIGRLRDGERVALAYCEPRLRAWCELEGGGWVDASWLVGSPAKLRATPPDPYSGFFEQRYPDRRPYYQNPNGRL